ncbi:gp688 [Bacillus phage G]|uniref:Gp688 n=1 Tax=Bacillus phage G TaxID=2884420 RepID=G3MB68_9CAUD|nr:gp688 [Bacillus phage G]AEO93931.1 gp688 [Bacillus phage G]
MDDKKDIKPKLILLPNSNKKKINLTSEEIEIKSKLIDIEKKIDSLENIVEAISDELPETFYSSDIFMTIIAGAALTAATEVVNEVFGIKQKNNEDDNDPLI